MLIKTLFHIRGELNLPTLLFKVGLLTLIHMDSMIYLDKFKKVRVRQVRKFNNLLNKKEGNITWQSSQVTLAAKACPQVVSSQATLATMAPPHAAFSSLAGRQVHLATGASPQLALNSQVDRQATPRASPHTVSRQASQADSILSQAESAVSQAFLVDSAHLQAESTVSQVGNPQASPADRTLSQAKVRSPRQVTFRQPQ